MSFEAMERRLTLAFAIATYVHVTKDSLFFMIFGTVVCMVYPWWLNYVSKKG